MEEEYIIELATRFRRGIEKAKVQNEFVKDQNFRNFPLGCCGVTTNLLAKFLMDNGVVTKLVYVNGTYLDFSHAWLQTNNMIVDITGDQFKYVQELFNYNESIYVGDYNDFYSLFEVNCEDEYPKEFVLEDRRYCFQLSHKKIYDIILKYI